MTTKKVSESKVTQTNLIMPGDTNRHNSLFGGNLMSMIDKVSSICFLRHTRALGMTASVDNLNFIKPLPVSHALTVDAMISGTGTRSAEVFAKIIGEDLATGERYLAATAFSTFVVVEEMKTDKIPNIEAETEEENYIMSGYNKRRRERLENRESDKDFQKHIPID